MSTRAIYRSLVNRLAVEIPLFAKSLVDDALARHRLDPDTVTPFELKRVVDDEIGPRLARILETSRSPHVSTLGGGLVQLGRDGAIRLISPSARKLLGVPSGMSSDALRRFLEERGVLRWPEQLEALGKKLAVWTVEIDESILQCHAAGILDPDPASDRIVAVAVTLLDLTLERELEKAMSEVYEALRDRNRDLGETLEALREMAQKAQAASDAKSRFLATMSHEIRTPLNSVIGMTSLLLDTELSAEQREYAQTSVQSARVLLSLITDILDLSRLEAGRLELERIPFDVRVTVGEAAGIAQSRLRARPVEFDWTVEESVPERLEGDPGRLRQVLLNLLDNAVKFTSRGHVRLRAAAAEPGPERRPEGIVLRLVVEDTGIGIPSERLEQLFDAFTQADASTTRRFGGSGLGLSICRRLVDRMGGTMTAESVEGAGSTFRCDIPFPVATETSLGASREEDAPTPKEVPGATWRSKARRGRILVAEDNAVNQLVITRILERLGYGVDVATNGREVIEALSGAYDLVLMDCQMPEMDGLDATRLIREGAKGVRDKSIPVIALTADTIQGRERCLAVGMNDYVPKPVEPAVLQRVLDRWIRPEGESAPDS